MSIIDQVKKNLREWYALAADRTGDMAKISVRMYDKYGISREIERQLSELGSHVYHAVDEGRTDFAEDEEFQTAIDRIKVLEQDLEAKVSEIDEIKVQRQQRQAEREEAAAAAAAAGRPGWPGQATSRPRRGTTRRGSGAGEDAVSMVEPLADEADGPDVASEPDRMSPRASEDPEEEPPRT